MPTSWPFWLVTIVLALFGATQGICAAQTPLNQREKGVKIQVDSLTTATEVVVD